MSLNRIESTRKDVNVQLENHNFVYVTHKGCGCINYD